MLWIQTSNIRHSEIALVGIWPFTSLSSCRHKGINGVPLGTLLVKSYAVTILLDAGASRSFINKDCDIHHNRPTHTTLCFSRNLVFLFLWYICTQSPSSHQGDHPHLFSQEYEYKWLLCHVCKLRWERMMTPSSLTQYPPCYLVISSL